MDQIKEILENVAENDLEPETPLGEEKEINEEVRELTETIEGLTGGTTSEPSPVVYTPGDWDRATESAAKCLRIMGEGEGDGVINLGAPEPHLSALSFRDGSESIGADVLNQSFEDFTELNQNFYDLLENAGEASVLIGLPAVTYALGRQFEEETGKSPAEAFPELERGFFGGEVLDEAMREDLRDQWGFEETGLEEFASYVFGFFLDGEYYEVNDYLAGRMAENPGHSMYVDFYLPQDENFNSQAFLDALYENSPAFREVEGRLGVVQEVNIRDLEDYPTEKEGLKAQRVKDNTGM